MARGVIYTAIAVAAGLGALALMLQYGGPCEGCPTVTVTRAMEPGDVGLHTDVSGGQTMVMALVSFPGLGVDGATDTDNREARAAAEGARETADLINAMCPPGGMLKYDVDDTQNELEGIILAEVFCSAGGEFSSLNAAVAQSQYGSIYDRFCPYSEFADSPWAEAGCPSATITRAMEPGEVGLATDVPGGETLVMALVYFAGAGDEGTAEERAAMEGAQEAADHINSLCPPGSYVRYDVDSTQDELEGIILAEVFCRGPDGAFFSMNGAVVESQHGSVFERFCPASELANRPWAAGACST